MQFLVRSVGVVLRRLLVLGVVCVAELGAEPSTGSRNEGGWDVWTQSVPWAGQERRISASDKLVLLTAEEREISLMKSRLLGLFQVQNYFLFLTITTPHLALQISFPLYSNYFHCRNPE